jgi:hypothetical protein
MPKKWLLFSVLLKFFDVLTTYISLQNGGIELNPVIVYLIGNFGITSGLLITFFFFTFVICFLKNKYLFKIIIVLLTIVVINNLIAIWGLL